jgi:hypothetical protein
MNGRKISYGAIYPSIESMVRWGSVEQFRCPALLGTIHRSARGFKNGWTIESACRIERLRTDRTVRIREWIGKFSFRAGVDEGVMREKAGGGKIFSHIAKTEKPAC